jgi:hypothetical protein
MTEGEAIALLATYGVDPDDITISRQTHISTPLGDVISISPEVGTLVPPDQEFVLVVSLGPAAAMRWTGDNRETIDAVLSQGNPAQAALICNFVYLDIPDDPTRLNDSACTIRWNGYNWLGMGQFGTIEPVSETLEVFAQPVVLTLSGCEAAWVTAARDTAYKGREVVIYRGVFDSRTVELLDDPEELWSGYMDFMEIEVAKNLGAIRLHCEHRMRRLARTYRWTDEGQRTRHANDRFFEFTWRIRKDQAKWGTRDLDYAAGGASGRGGPGRNRRRPD